MANDRNIGRGPSQRQLRVAELIRRTLSDVFLRGDFHDPALSGVPITVGEVTISPDLKVANIYIAPLGGKNGDEVLAAVKDNGYELRRTINKTLTLRYSPELRFHLDDTFDRMDASRALFEREDVRRDLDED